jgi:hypothetical protein
LLIWSQYLGINLFRDSYSFFQNNIENLQYFEFFTKSFKKKI